MVKTKFSREEEKAFVKATLLPVKKVKPFIEEKDFELCDKKASLAAKKLAAFLNGVSEAGLLMYGHQNDMHRKAGPHERPFSSSDTFDVTGEYAAVCGLDALCLVGTENGHWYWGKKKRVKSCVRLAMKSIKKGAIISLSAHMPNFQLLKEWQEGVCPPCPLYHHEDKKIDKKINASYKERPLFLKDSSVNFSGYTPNDLRGCVVRDVMPGRPLNSLYCEYLDLVCDFCLALQKKDQALIWRPFHENSGNWFWWGAASSSVEDFVALWKYTYEYFTEKRNVHNLIWAYSPGSEYHCQAGYESRYPGDAYVDLLGFDMYQQVANQGNSFWALYEEQCSLISGLAVKHKKLFANTETGIMNADGKALLLSGNHDFEWYEKIAAVCLKYSACYFLLWANFWSGGAYYSPYIKSFKKSGSRITMLEGHEMLDSFIRLYNNPKLLFSDEVKDRE